jgi:hypothetical protein
LHCGACTIYVYPPKQEFHFLAGLKLNIIGLVQRQNADRSSQIGQ